MSVHLSVRLELGVLMLDYKLSARDSFSSRLSFTKANLGLDLQDATVLASGRL